MDLCCLRAEEVNALVGEENPALRGAKSVEEAATILCTDLYEKCRSRSDGTRSLVLSRIFLSLPFPALDRDIQAVVRARPGANPGPADQFLTLLGTRGDLPAWCDRRLSKGHQAIPLNAQTVATVPMLSRCFQQIGFDLSIVLRPEQGIHLQGVEKSFGIFHVAEAPGSPFVPTQEEFVKPHGVRSVIGCGTMLPNGAVSLWIGFTRHSIADPPLALISMMPAFWQQVQPLYRRRAIFVG